ncbi:MAG: alanine--tRNA ligase-related protein [Patescibacteria group bacterium]
MTSQDIRDKFVAFFKEKGHTELPASSLVPTDPSVLFTTAGMQQFKEWFVKPELAKHKRVVTIQPCLRTSDIEAVGDETHLTYFEMLGNFSFGVYGKKEAIEYALEWFRKDFGVEESMLTFSYFGGEGVLEEDSESRAILFDRLDPKSIEKKGRSDNFWGPTGDTGPCGPTVEFYYKGIEIWNLVFNEYFFDGNNYKKLEKLGIDTGAGLERIAATLNGFESVFETDELKALLDILPEGDLRSRRIIVDHVRAINGLIGDGVIPSNKAQGAVLRRLIRRAFTHGRLISADDDLVAQLVSSTVARIVKTEVEKFSQTLKQSMKIYSRILEKSRKEISGEDAFLLKESYGLPVELTQELARKDGYSVDMAGFQLYELKHVEASAMSSPVKFKGGLVERTPETTRLHTAHHLLLAALRKVLGEHVVQRGSNITSDRLRIDFSHPRGVKEEELRKVEKLVNQWIKDDLEVTREEMSLQEAFKKGALGEFGATYPEKVSVYSIGNPPVSVEICGGPHVTKTSEIGKFRIVKEESSGSGIRRIRAVLD